jgi:hypothetical protein
MKAKLIKRGKNYYAFDENTIMVGTTDDFILRLKPLLTTKLSIVNCEQITLGYNLDEIVYNYLGVKEEDFSETDHLIKDAIEHGLNQSFELSKDKIFTKVDMLKAIIMASSIPDPAYTDGKKKSSGEIVKNMVHSVSEWDVEIICMTSMGHEKSTNTGIPELDEDGCLILRRVKDEK